MTETLRAALEASARAHLKASIAAKERLLELSFASLIDLSEACAAAVARGGKLLICGNGGSAADAQHMAAELVVRLSSSFERRALPAISLCTDSSLLTACANDYGYNEVFARQIEALGRAEDLVLGISTSGNSPNVVRAFEAAKSVGLRRALMSGGSGGKLKDLADHALIVPSPVTAHIQECHIAAIHIICDAIERVCCQKS
jgi:D-sedoheptulose 7-phosphate isomerase